MCYEACGSKSDFGAANVMLMINEGTKIYLYLPPTDMRKSIDSLCTLVSEQLVLNPADGHLFIFRNKSGNKLKCLYYEPNCFTLWYRRLEKGRFVFPKDKNGHLEMTQDHFRWLLASDKYTQCGRISTCCEGYF
jgi:transposase